MFTMEYWTDKVLTMFEEYNPKVYRKLKRAGTLGETAEKMAQTSLSMMERLYRQAKETHLPQNQSPEELTTTEWENQTLALEMTEETLMASIMAKKA